MNNDSLAHRYPKKQQHSSRIDDVLHFGVNGRKGMMSMSHERRLASFAEELVALYAKYEHGDYILFLSDLTDAEQNELTRLYMEATDRQTSECVYGNDFSIENEYTCALLAMLQDDNKKTRERFSQVTLKNTVLYYSLALQDVIDDACVSYQNNMNNEAGLRSQYDRDMGDIFWSKY